MHGHLNEILVVRRSSFWGRRLIGLFGISSSVTGILVVAMGALDPSSGFTMVQIAALVWVFAIGLLFLTIATLRINRVGIYEEGLAPPMKVLSALFHEPYIARWNEIEEIILHPPARDGRPPKSYKATVRLVSGKQVRFTGPVIGDRFRSELAARRFHALLSIASRRQQSGQLDALRRDSEVTAVLGSDWPDGTAYRRTLASKIGIVVGGSLALVSAAFLVLGPREQGLVWRALFISGGFLGLWATLSPYFLRNLAKRLDWRV